MNRKGKRSSAAYAFIEPEINNSNLHLKLNTKVDKIIIKDNKAIGVEYRNNKGELNKKFANKEVVVAAGSFITPKLLMLSGIGNADELKLHDIGCIADLPGVGENLIDHPECPIIAKANGAYGYYKQGKGWRMIKNGLQFLLFGTGPVNSTGVEAGAFINPLSFEDLPSIQAFFVPSIYMNSDTIGLIDDDYGMSITTVVTKPLSRGKVKLKSANPNDKPIIELNLLKHKNFNTSVGDEGGFSPQLKTAEEAIELILEAIKTSGYKAGKDVFLSLDPASSEFFREGKYFFEGEDKLLDTEEMIGYLKTLVSKYPINSIEDGLHEDDWEGWKSLTKSLGSEVQLIGDDLFATNPKRIRRGIEEKVANSVLIKMNQIGTISETMEAVSMSQENGYKAVISHRSGETEDTSISDLAIGLAAGQIKTGAPSRTDRVSKYNRLLILEQKFKIPFIKENEVV